MAAQATLPTTKRGYRQATAQDVRDFAQANGLPAGGSRGRLPVATIAEFNAAHSKGKGRAWYGRTPVGEREYVMRGPKGGVQKRATVQSSEVRAWAEANGYDVAPKGRLSTEVKTAYLASL